ncbi:hypothetical protein SPHINGO8BC_51563 [Sphingobacterium multivorum]|uniref:Uncharacterized protein n=1 Tax=Sphingobacterium multivorum TaxID=28454 RepID=A0A654D323_SPHMU|nr:hypothetical protein SPHINGO8BC_51563 [Sphingobacterium multivorum]
MIRFLIKKYEKDTIDSTGFYTVDAIARTRTYTVSEDHFWPGKGIGQARK